MTLATERRVLARALYRRGMPPTEIAQRLGVCRGTAYSYLRDLTPNGPGAATPRWTPELVVDAIRAVARDRGAVPGPVVFTPPPRGSGLPSMSTIIALFGSWRAALEAAGL